MINLLEIQNNLMSQSYTKPALVTRIKDEKIWVRIDHVGSSLVIEAKSALMQNNYRPELGDDVLVSGEHLQLCYIIGVINQKNQDFKSSQIESKSGAKAKSSINDGHECLSIEDENGYMLFEYDAVNKTSKIYSPKGDLSFNALDGDILLNSANNIKCHSMGVIDLQSNTAAQIRVTNNDNQSSMNFSSQGVSLSTEHLAIKSAQADIEIQSSRFTGKTLSTVVEHSKLMAKKIETQADRILEKAKNIYRTIEQLHQTKTKRMRTIVENDFQLKSQSTTIHAKKNVNIDGDKINLG
ncbi:MAG: DUF3540 domain-containing protein [Saccharospirillaceae bacterium]|nr:DUF3540 domain-containing protein [Pseudomonadales bacterium]NRB81533.1 DUF3540 domain-containing protein [Saccharospirillaceae bacterium]